MQRLCTAEPSGGNPLWDHKNLPRPAGARTACGEGGLTATPKPGRERERERQRERGREREMEGERHIASEPPGNTMQASFLGNSTLGCYVIHFIFRDRMTEAIQMMMPMLSWDLTGLLLPSAIILLCLAFMSMGPVGHYILIAPQFLASFVRRRLFRKP